MRILVKYPTRSRPEIFLSTLTDYVKKAENNSKILYLISCDEDDLTMNEDVIKKATDLPANILIKKGVGKNKIEACNRDINDLKIGWDIVLLISDDMHVQKYGWDQTIREDMNRLYPNTDGCLWYHDGTDQKRISTLSCLGRTYYDRFKYLYHESYESLWCDNEYTEIAKRLNKITFIDNVIIKHNHHCFGGIKKDALYTRNDALYEKDRSNYINRRINISRIIEYNS